MRKEHIKHPQEMELVPLVVPVKQHQVRHQHRPETAKMRVPVVPVIVTVLVEVSVRFPAVAVNVNVQKENGEMDSVNASIQRNMIAALPTTTKEDVIVTVGVRVTNIPTPGGRIARTVHIGMAHGHMMHGSVKG